ncbi:ABC transporter C family member 3 [Glycine soja]|uniref:ABC transporter C family member 3 n=1 Tax=Glycine soja TaxID=3848 RepID=A0A0B2SG82_GLYSO|nr:ABC transporter C family member 3 [Glycine soja]
MFLNLPVSSLQEKFQGKVMEFKDKRMKATFEILKNIRILKLQAWEMKFLSKIIQLRKTEEIWLKKFLAEELQTDVVEKLPWGSSDKAIELVDGYFSWDLSSINTTVKNINLANFHGMRVAVCATVGSDKSSLLSCIIGEVPKISGTLKICGTKAYVSQSPWIQGGKIIIIWANSVIQ